MFSYFANPHRFMALSGAILPFLAVIAGIMLAAGWVWALIFAPEDLYQGASARIMFVHVPAAWVGLSAYAVMAVSSLIFLIWRHVVADIAAKSAAPTAAVFTFLCLVTGSLWGYPTWGTYWVWDARLTSMLFQLFLILGYIGLRASFTNEQEAAKAGAILCLVGAINLPIIRFSVDWWNSLHQTSSILSSDARADEMCESLNDPNAIGVCLGAVEERSLAACNVLDPAAIVKTCQDAVIKGFGLAPEFLWPLLFNVVAMSLVFGAIMLAAMRIEVFKRQYLASLARQNKDTR